MRKEPMTIDGLRVIDVLEPLVINITDTDIKRGSTKDPGCCAAARACMREKHATAARVHVSRVYLRVGKAWFRYHTSPALRQELIAFDRGGKFQPGEYRLLKSRPSSHATGKRQGGPDRPKAKVASKTKRKRTRPYHLVTGIRPRGANR